MIYSKADVLRMLEAIRLALSVEQNDSIAILRGLLRIEQIKKDINDSPDYPREHCSL